MICLPGSHSGMIQRADIRRKVINENEASKGNSSLLSSAPSPIGVIALTGTTSSLQHHRGTKLGIQIATQYRGKGYGSEALNWTLDWAFNFGGFHRVMLEAQAFNDGALRLYERLGFVKEGVLREAVWFNGRWYSQVIYGMLESDWREIRGTAEGQTS
jgi:RimJ/RimL family protein N-acetyltransferase